MVARVESLLEQYRVKTPEEMSQEELAVYEIKKEQAEQAYQEKIKYIAEVEIPNDDNYKKDGACVLNENQRYDLAVQIYQKRFGIKFQLFLDEHPNFKDQPEIKGWAQFTFEEILQMESDGVNIPKEVLDWAHSMQDSDKTDYVAEDVETLSFDADDSEMVKLQKKTIALNKEAKEKEAEITEKETRLKELAAEAETIKSEQEDNTKNSLKQIQDLTQEWKDLSEKSKSGELSESDNNRLKELGNLLNGEDGKLTLEVQASSSDMQDLMNLMDDLSVDIEQGVEIGQDTIQIAKEISSQESFYHPKMLENTTNMVVNSVQGNILDAKGQNLSINAMDQGNKLVEFSNTLNSELMVGQYKAIYDFAKMFTTKADETLQNTQEVMGDAWNTSSEEAESTEDSAENAENPEEANSFDADSLAAMNGNNMGLINAVIEAGKESKEIEEKILDKIEEIKTEKEEVEEDIEETQESSAKETTEEVSEAAEEGDIEGVMEAAEEAESTDATEEVASSEAAELDAEIEETNEDSLTINELLESYIDINNENGDLNKIAQGVFSASVVTGTAAIGYGITNIVTGVELISIGTALSAFWLTAPIGAAFIACGTQCVVIGSSLTAIGSGLVTTGGVGLDATVTTGDQVVQTDETLTASAEEIELIENNETEEEVVEEGESEESNEEVGEEEGAGGPRRTRKSSNTGNNNDEEVEEAGEEFAEEIESKSVDEMLEAVAAAVEGAEGTKESTASKDAGNTKDPEEMDSDEAQKEGDNAAKEGRSNVKQGKEKQKEGDNQTKSVNKIGKEMKAAGKESEKIGKNAKKTEKQLEAESKATEKEVDKAQKEIEKKARDSAQAIIEEGMLSAEYEALNSASEIAAAAIQAKQAKAANAPQPKKTPGLLGGGGAQAPNIQQEIVIVSSNQGRMNEISGRFNQLNTRITKNRTSIIKLQGTVNTRLRKFEKIAKEKAKLQKEQQKIEQAKQKRIAQQKAIVGIINNVFSIISAVGTIIGAVSKIIGSIAKVLVSVGTALIAAGSATSWLFGAGTALIAAGTALLNIAEDVLEPLCETLNLVSEILSKIGTIGTVLCTVVNGIIDIANGQTLAGIIAIGMAAVQAVMSFVGAGSSGSSLAETAQGAIGSCIGATLQLAGAAMNVAATSMTMQNNIAVAQGKEADPELAKKAQIVGMAGALTNMAGSMAEGIGTAVGSMKEAGKGIAGEVAKEATKAITREAAKKISGSVLSFVGSATTTAAQLVSMNKKGKGGVLEAALNLAGGILSTTGGAVGTGTNANEIAGTVFQAVGTTVASSANLSRAVKKKRGEKENHGETILEATGNALSAVGDFTKALPGKDANGNPAKLTDAQKAQLSGSVINLAGTAISTAGIITSAIDGKNSKTGANLLMAGNAISFAGQSISTISGVAQGLKSNLSADGKSPYSKAEAAGTIISLLGQAATFSSQMSTSIKAMNGEKANAFDEYLALAGTGLSVVGNMTSTFGKIAETAKAQKKENDGNDGTTTNKTKKTKEERAQEREERRAKIREERNKPLAERIKEKQEARAERKEERKKAQAERKEERAKAREARKEARAEAKEQRKINREKRKQSLRVAHDMFKDYRSMKKNIKNFVKSNGSDEAIGQEVQRQADAFNEKYKAFIPEGIVDKIKSKDQAFADQTLKNIMDGKITLKDGLKNISNNLQSQNDGKFLSEVQEAWRKQHDEAINALVDASKETSAEGINGSEEQGNETDTPVEANKKEAEKKQQEQKEKVQKGLAITAAVVQEATNIAKVAFQIAEVLEQDKHKSTQEHRQSADINLAALKRSRALVRTITRKNGAESRHSHYNRKA